MKYQTNSRNKILKQKNQRLIAGGSIVALMALIFALRKGKGNVSSQDIHQKMYSSPQSPLSPEVMPKTVMPYDAERFNPDGTLKLPEIKLLAQSSNPSNVEIPVPPRPKVMEEVYSGTEPAASAKPVASVHVIESDTAVVSKTSNSAFVLPKTAEEINPEAINAFLDRTVPVVNEKYTRVKALTPDYFTKGFNVEEIYKSGVQGENPFQRAMRLEDGTTVSVTKRVDNSLERIIKKDAQDNEMYTALYNAKGSIMDAKSNGVTYSYNSKGEIYSIARKTEDGRITYYYDKTGNLYYIEDLTNPKIKKASFWNAVAQSIESIKYNFAEGNYPIIKKDFIDSLGRIIKQEFYIDFQVAKTIE